MNRHDYRKYLWAAQTEKGRYCASRKTIGLAFCDSLKKRLEVIDRSDFGSPLARPLIEVGYTNDIPTSLADHRDHRALIKIMNVFECIISLLFPRKNPKLHQFAIYSCVAPHHAPVAEILFTRLCDSCTGNGGGFSAYPAGLSNKSAYDYDSFHWEQVRNWSLRNINYMVSHAEEKAKFAVIDLALERAESERSRREAEVARLASDPGYRPAAMEVEAWAELGILDEKMLEGQNELDELTRQWEAYQEAVIADTAEMIMLQYAIDELLRSADMAEE